MQLYTGLVYRGPSLIDEILDGLSARRRGARRGAIADLVGTRAREWALAP